MNLPNFQLFTIFSIALTITSCSKNIDDTFDVQELSAKLTTSDGFTTANDEATLPETTFGNETNCSLSEEDEFIDEFINLLNVHRKSIGLNPVEQNTTANYLAFKHTKYMICNEDFRHANFGESANILKEMEKGCCASENLILGFNTPQKMLDGWLSSPGHKKNIENPNNTHTGFSAITDDKGSIWATQLFMKI